MGRRSLALTGLGLVTPLGVGVEALWGGLLEGRSAVRPVTGLDLADMPVTHYGQLPPVDFDRYLDPQESALWSQASRLAFSSAAASAIACARGSEA